ncbi:MAG: hypothetical protein AB1523_02640 [Bacillota bacterium]
MPSKKTPAARFDREKLTESVREKIAIGKSIREFHEREQLVKAIELLKKFLYRDEKGVVFCRANFFAEPPHTEDRLDEAIHTLLRGKVNILRCWEKKPTLPAQ